MDASDALQRRPQWYGRYGNCHTWDFEVSGSGNTLSPIRRHTLTLYLITGDMEQLRMSTFKAKMYTLQNDKNFQLKSILCLSVFNE